VKYTLYVNDIICLSEFDLFSLVRMPTPENKLAFLIIVIINVILVADIDIGWGYRLTFECLFLIISDLQLTEQI